MSQYFQIHPVGPQLRLVRRAVEMIRDGAVAAYPTDSTYALGCRIGDKNALERICRIRNLAAGHDFTLMCRDLSEVSTYAQVHNAAYRILKSHTPGPYTFILDGTKEVPRRLLHPKRKTIGLRVPDHKIAQALLTELDEPMMTTSLILPGDDDAMNDAEDIRERLQKQVDLVIDGGPCGTIPTSVITFTGDLPEVTRKGKGDTSAFE